MISSTMNLLSLIIIFLALVIVGSIAFIAWEVTSEKIMPHSDDPNPGASQQPKDSPDSTDQAP